MAPLGALLSAAVPTSANVARLKQEVDVIFPEAHTSLIGEPIHAGDPRLTKPDRDV